MSRVDRILIGKGEQPVHLLAQYGNRHGLVAGATGTGKTISLMVLAEGFSRLGVPVFLSGMARGLMGRSHEIWFRHQRRAALREADFVLLAGVPCDFRLNYGLHINRKANLVSVNRDDVEVRKNRRPKLGVTADPGDFLTKLSREFVGDLRRVVVDQHRGERLR